MSQAFRQALAALLLALAMPALCFALSGGEAAISVRPPPDDFLSRAAEGEDPALSAKPGALAVVGTISLPGFAAKSLKNVRINDASGRELEFLIDKGSVYSEFDDGVVNSLKIMLLVPEESLASGAPKLLWGGEVQGTLSSEVPKIELKKGSAERYRAFSLEQAPAAGDGSSKVASIQVVVDDYADNYYWWYLLPLAILVAAVAARRLRKE